MLFGHVNIHQHEGKLLVIASVFPRYHFKVRNLAIPEQRAAWKAKGKALTALPMTESSCDTPSNCLFLLFAATSGCSPVAPCGHFHQNPKNAPSTCIPRAMKASRKTLLRYRECKTTSGYPPKCDVNTDNSYVGAFVLSTRVSLRWADWCWNWLIALEGKW